MYLFEQLAFLDSLTSIEPPAFKRRRIRHQHFWRDSEKLAVRERVYVRSADVQSAMEAGLPVTSCNHLSPAEHTTAWTVCLTVFGAKELLNRKISPLGRARGCVTNPRSSILLAAFSDLILATWDQQYTTALLCMLVCQLQVSDYFGQWSPSYRCSNMQCSLQP